MKQKAFFTFFKGPSFSEKKKNSRYKLEVHMPAS